MLDPKQKKLAGVIADMLCMALARRDSELYHMAYEIRKELIGNEFFIEVPDAYWDLYEKIFNGDD